MPAEVVTIIDSFTLEERRAMLRQPLSERRRFLEQQVAKIISYYELDVEWRELQAGDIIEY